MTTTPPLTVYYPKIVERPNTVFSNTPTPDSYRSPYSTHPIWWLEKADIFFTIRGIVYGLHQIHFKSSTLIQEMLNFTRPPNDSPFGTTFHTAIPFDTIKAATFYDLIMLLYYPEKFETDSNGWLDIFKLAQDWNMPHIARRATRELDNVYYQKHPFHMRRWDTTLRTRVQDYQRQLRHKWVTEHLEQPFEEDDDEESIIDLYLSDDRA